MIILIVVHGALVVNLWTCYGALQIVVLLLFFFNFKIYIIIIIIICCVSVHVYLYKFISLPHRLCCIETFLFIEVYQVR